MSGSPRKIKVLQVYRTYFPDSQGGAEEVIRQICRNTVSDDIESRVFVPSPNPAKQALLIDDAKVVQVKLNFEIASCGFCLTSLQKFKEQVEWADVVHYHFPWPFADIMHLYCAHNKPTVMTYHSDIVRQQGILKLYSPLMHRFLDAMDRIIATSPNYQQSSKVLKKYKDKVSNIPLGIDESSYPKVDAQTLNTVRDSYGEEFFFFVGVLRYYKGLHILIDACKNADFKVVIAGSGPLDQELRKQVKDLNLTNVQFAGQVSDEEKMAMFKLCRGVVFASHVRSEAFGVTLLEGAMCSRPLITAETGTGTSYVNQDGETGLIVPANDAKALSGAMNRLTEDENLATKMGRCARTRYESLFTGKQMGKSYAEHYRALVEESKS